MSRSLVIVAFSAAVLFLPIDAHAARRRPVHSTVPDFNAEFTQGGYADRTSVAQGSSIEFHIATSVNPALVKIVNLAHPTEVLMVRSVSSTPRNCSGRSASGCGWPVTTVLAVPRSWATGYYAATFPTASGDRSIIFVVRDSTPGSWSSTVVVSPTHTYQAFNDYGGKALYSSDDPTGLTSLSFDRPYNQEAGLGRYPAWEKLFADWMTRQNRRFEVITDTDAEDPTILARYKVVVIVGQSEYWTAAARANLEQFSRNGGHIAIFGGNTMWWQVRLADNSRTLVGYKGLNFDPALGTEDRLVTTNWFDHPVNNPENRILGTSFRNGGYANRVAVPGRYEMVPVEQRTPWTVTDAQSWIFERTHLLDGSTFGREAAGLEVDGAIFNCGTSGNVLGAEGSDGAPLNYHIIATTPGSAGWGTMGFYVNSAGGAVFNAATQGWVWGLESSDIVETMTENVLNRFGLGIPFVYDPVQSSVLAQDTFNCRETLLPLPGWRSNVGRGAVTSSCAYEGPGGLELAGPGEIAIARSFAPTDAPRDQVELRFYLKADEAEQRTEFPMSIVTLRNRDGATVQNIAQIEIEKTQGGPRIRVARNRAQGFGASSYVPLTSGWHLVELSWRSPGTIELQVDGGTAVTIDNPDAGQRVNDLVLQYPATTTGQSGRVCVDAIATGTEKLDRMPALK